MRRALVRLGAVLLWAGSLACATPGTFTTGYEVQPLDAKASLGPLAVRRFADRRPLRVEPDPLRGFLLCLPFVPKVTLTEERPDELVRARKERIDRKGWRKATPASKRSVPPPFEEYAYPASFARAVAEDIRATGIFEEVRYVGTDAEDASPYLLMGEIRATQERESVTSYLLGVPGVFLWLLAIPAAKTTHHVSVDLSLSFRETGEVIWSGSADGEISSLFSLYSPVRKYGRGDIDDYGSVVLRGSVGVDRTSVFQRDFEALRRGMLEVRSDLVAALEDWARRRMP